MGNEVRVVVIGSNFAGFTSALEIRRQLDQEKIENHVVVLSNSDKFLFVPSLIWVPFGEREIEDITIPISDILKGKGIEFVNAAATKIDPQNKNVEVDNGSSFQFDYLVIATGFKLDWSIQGLGPHAFTQCVCTPNDALMLRKAFEDLVKNPGPVIVGATQRAGCIGAAYEFLLNMDYHLRKHNVRHKVDLTFISPEPFLGHFGIGGLPGAEKLIKEFFDHLDIKSITNAEIDHAEPGKIVLTQGQELEAALAMIVPPFIGQDVIFNSPGIGDASGLIPVTDTYQHVNYPFIFSAGAAISVPSPFITPVAVGVPKTGYPADAEAKVVAQNVVLLASHNAHLSHRPFAQLPALCVMDAGHKEVLILANHLFPPRDHAVLLPNPIYDAGKRVFEHYYLWKVKHGLSFLP